MNKKLHISMCPDDIKNSIIKNLYHTQGISGIFNIKFKVVNKPIGLNTRDNIDHWEFDGAEIIVDLNET